MYYSQYAGGKPDGAAVLVKFREEQIEYISFRNGVVCAKSIEQNKNILTKVFVQGNLEDVMPKNHLRNLEFEGDIHNSMSVCKKAGKILIGYTGEDLMLNGLGLILI